MDIKPWIEIKIALAPYGWNCRMVVLALKKDPWQSRISVMPFPLKNPKTGKQRYLSEYIEDYVGDIRLGIEATDGVVFVSRFVGGPDKGSLTPANYFIPQVVLSKEQIRSGQVEDLRDLQSVKVDF